MQRPGNQTTVIVDPDGKIELKFANRNDFNAFLAGCKSMGYTSHGSGYYSDGVKCHWAGSSLSVDPATLTIEIEAVWEA